MLALTACNDYLDVDAPSKQTTELVFSSTSEASQALNGIYAKVLADNAFGRYAYNDLMLNSDVEFAANSNEVAQTNAPKRFDCTSESGTVEKFWNALYSGVETANEFIYNLEHSEMYNNPATAKEGEELKQMMGEAKVMRAMFYHELLCYWGDIPFSLEPTYVTQNFVLPVTSRDEVYMQLINDLKAIAPYMSSSSTMADGVERVSQEACWAMIARMALQAGGYSLRPVEGNTSSYGKMARPANSNEFYQIARNYADSVIQAGTHSLTKSFQQVFVDECNLITSTGDDPIFELPFGEGSSGYVGYYQGAKLESTEGVTPHNWGEVNGGAQLEAFYRFRFDEKDLRRDYVNALWYYTSTNLPAVVNSYTTYNNKWSKLWNTIGLGANTTGATGINFPYIRYADVLLMFAEAENELNGPTQAAQDALKAVRRRAFSSDDYAEKVEGYVAQAAGDKKSFLDAVLDERAWELAGENSRWKDLVRNNQYAEKLYYTFIRYYSAAVNAQTSSPYDDMIAEYDNIAWQETLPYSMFSCIISNPVDKNYYVNTQQPVRYIVNAYKPSTTPQLGPENYMIANELPYTPISERQVTGLESSSSTIGWTETTLFNWCEDGGYPKAQVLYSLYGFIRGDINSNILLVVDGKETKIDPVSYNAANLPVVRYILPLPAEAVARSGGVYTQKYGHK